MERQAEEVVYMNGTARAGVNVFRLGNRQETASISAVALTYINPRK